MSWQTNPLRALIPPLLPSGAGWTFSAIGAHQLREVLLDAPAQALVYVPDGAGRHGARLNLQFGEELYLTALAAPGGEADVPPGGDFPEVPASAGRTFTRLHVWELRQLLRLAGEAPVWVADLRGRVRSQVNVQIGAEVYVTGDAGDH
ncbi:hypothetical protein [Deinococcus soli (ex Cha et al. 2016)]|uniref:Uncharacterized protein n=2 Tax=Deinococcus soli (ex Cha et al. 2016) TaxID=1309411 RepID=A0ACC6KG72_9DEIO|nr:hypothetical protein [Deinococcus soli (ex Cha et al. 2016)]MDR6218551.1 hypothetical protein [Deinococcus soli (ex Cha et al. 2016)]MDR6329291.1 hypothetical protein [Deinococcus soli (ex Cha et al. 2016)]MDR6751564.1 hypothetical protein [Deinococcus soli (ex Cha et al. 2016)]